MPLSMEEYIEQQQKYYQSELFKRHLPETEGHILRMLRQFGFYSVPIEYYLTGDHIIGLSLHNTGNGSVPSRELATFHNHNYFELIYVYRGGCINYFQDSSLLLGQNDLLLLNPNILHDLHTLSTSDCIFNIMLSRDLFEQILFPLAPDSTLFSNFFTDYIYELNKTQDFLKFTELHDPLFPSILRGIIEEHINSRPCCQSVIRSALSLLFSLLSREYTLQHGTFTPANENVKQITAMISYIQKNCTSVTLGQLEKEFSYSASYLSKLLVKHTGKSFTELSSHFKLERIRNLLENTNIPLSKLVEESGFNDLSYLNKAFKKRYGTTPSQYRKKQSVEAAFSRHETSSSHRPWKGETNDSEK